MEKLILNDKLGIGDKLNEVHELKHEQDKLMRGRYPKAYGMTQFYDDEQLIILALHFYESVLKNDIRRLEHED